MGRAMICCAVLTLGCGRLVADPFEGFYSGPPRPEDIERMRKYEQLVHDYKKANHECAKAAKVTLIIPLTPDGDQLQFICVSADDTSYKAQHAQDPVAPPATNLDSRLAPLVGQNISVAVSRLGGPQGEPIENGDVVFEWSRSHLYPIWGTSIWNDQLTEYCTISLPTDPTTHVVKSFKWTEQRGGCEWFAQKFDSAPQP
jgi:hypothetical protein